MNFNQIELCMLVIDVSGSMDKIERIGEVNKALEKFKKFAKSNQKISNKLYLSIIEFSGKVNIREPKLLKEFSFQELKADGKTDIDKGILTSFDELKKWKRKHNPTSIISDIYFVLITDLDADKISNSIKKSDWLKRLQKFGRSSNFSFFGYGVDGGNLDSIRSSNYPNFIINEELNIDSLFERIRSKIKQDFEKPFLSKFWDKLSSLGSPIDWKINNFLGKQLKKEFKLKGIGISILAFSIIGGIQFLKVNINFYLNHNHLERTFDHETGEAIQELQDLKDENIISKNTDIEYKLEIDREGYIFPNLRGILTYAYVDSLENFSKGKYSMNSSESLFESGLLIQRHLRNVIKTNFRQAKEIRATIQGETDAFVISSPITYNGEFGDIEVFANGNQRLSLKKGNKFKNNEALGVLRGISFWTFLRGRIDLFSEAKTSHHYWYKTNDFDYGGRYRKVIIEIRIK
ncbi:MAG: hypothetical protein R2825_24275 [Saprospiraceae bacterium]